MGASERDEWLRAAWTVTVAEQTDARRLVFVDEMGSNIALAPLYAWAPKGERAFCSTPRNRGKNTTLLSSISLEGMGPSLVVEGSTNKVLFETFEWEHITLTGVYRWNLDSQPTASEEFRPLRNLPYISG